ncbi:MAG TPA: FAD-binding oxidoreductase [Candidatus Angelobacter sp.]|nr:FAD-binding oxidoreductase [Candidatus Angelobacter sp.]
MTATANFAARLESAIESSHVSTDPQVCAGYDVDEIVPAAVATPASAEEAAEIVRFAALEKLALIPCGNRTKLGIGMPPARYDLALDMTGINQIAHYDPGDLTLSVDAGASFNEFAVPLYNQKQFLPLAVPFYFESSIGGIIASGVDSPLRHSYGTARDFLIGADFVDGTGRLCKSGGRVVKNVTGYDLHKLLIGSLGTLAVITRLNFRTFPAAAASRGFVASFPAPQEALHFRKLVEGSPLRPASIELVSPPLMQIFLEAESAAPEPPIAPLQGKFPSNSWHLCISVEGTSEVCERSAREFASLATSHQIKNLQLATLDETQGPDLWHYIGQAIPLVLEAFPSSAIFKVTLLPSRIDALLPQLQSLAGQASLPHATLARACGVIYFALLAVAADPVSVPHLSQAASAIFALCAKEGASATLPWCPTALKRHVNIWGSPGPDLPLQRSLKSAFDPQCLFAPGRLFSVAPS